MFSFGHIARLCVKHEMHSSTAQPLVVNHKQKYLL